MRGPPVQAPDGSIKYIKNLFHFPFTPNVVLSNPPLSRETVPWDPMCKDHPLDDQSTAAVANGRFYYLCEVRAQIKWMRAKSIYFFYTITTAKNSYLFLFVCYLCVQKTRLRRPHHNPRIPTSTSLTASPAFREVPFVWLEPSTSAISLWPMILLSHPTLSTSF